jgi:transposase
MDEKELYRQVLGITHPWVVKDVRMNLPGGEIVIEVALDPCGHECPHCGLVCGHHDSKVRRWRHLDTCQYRTVIEGRVPRVKCKEHGVQQVRVPWAEEFGRFTVLFESLVINWLRDASVSTVAEQFRLTWDEVDGIQQRAVRRGLTRRAERRIPVVEHVLVDETSFQKGHEYVTVVSDSQSGSVVHVSDDRKKESLVEYYEGLSKKARERIRTVSMDMSAAYISATLECIPAAADKICFDKFHVMKLLGDAVDKTRRSEHRALLSEGDESLKRTKYLWLTGRENLDRDAYARLADARHAAVKTAKAWEIKEFARSLWHYTTSTWAQKAWKQLTNWTDRCRLPHVKKAGQTIKNHIDGIINAVVKRVNNAGAESINAKIQNVKRRACGFRNRERFRNAIYFHLGNLDMHPVGGNKYWTICHTDP